MIGSRCQYSVEGLREVDPKCQQQGTIVGESRDGKSWRVLLDGYRSAAAFHKSFIEIVSGAGKED